MLFRKKIDKRCSYCIHSTAVDEDHVLCTKKGLRPFDGKCRKFQYDPTKRIPGRAKAPDFQKYDQQDFSL